MALSTVERVLTPFTLEEISDSVVRGELQRLCQQFIALLEPTHPDANALNKCKRQLFSRLGQRVPDLYDRCFELHLPDVAYLAHKNLMLADFSYMRLRGPAGEPIQLIKTILEEVDFQGADLQEADLERAVLRRANLRETCCERARFTHADLHKSDMMDARLAQSAWLGADLYGVRMQQADCTQADMAGAKFFGANLRMACLAGANLEGAALEDADLQDAILTGTILDPHAPIAGLNRQQLELHGFELTADRGVLGYRTQLSQVVGKTYYYEGYTYRAPWFSRDIKTPCHPGLYFYASPQAVMQAYPGKEIVEVKIPLGEDGSSTILHVGDQYRTPEFTVTRRLTPEDIASLAGRRRGRDRFWPSV